jgi:hypothetical protein
MLLPATILGRAQMNSLTERGGRLEAEARELPQRRDVSDELDATYREFLAALRKQQLAHVALDGVVPTEAQRLIEKQTEPVPRGQLFALLKVKPETDRLAFVRSMIQFLLASESAAVG